jgi:type I restriction enzyme S subunit
MNFARLDDVCEINPRMPKSLVDGDAATFLPMAAISEGGHIDFEERREVRDVKKGYTYFERGDVLVAKITPCFENGKAARTISLSNPIGFGSTEFHVLRAGEEIDRSYLFHMIWNSKFREAGAKNMTGSAGQKRVPADFLKRLEIPFPPIDEQRRIAAILDKADALRRKRKRAIELLDSLTQSIFLGMFGDLVESRAYSRGTVSDWVADFDTGKNLAPDPDGKQIDGYRVLKVSAVTMGVFLPQESKPLPVRYEPPASHIVNEGDLLFSRANTAELIGATAYVETAHQKLVLPDKIWRFVWREANSPNPRFVHALFSTPSFRHALTKRATGASGSMKNISKPKVLGIEIALPAREQQDAFAARYRVIQQCLSTATMQSTMLEDQFSSLQSRAFSGQQSAQARRPL